VELNYLLWHSNSKIWSYSLWTMLDGVLMDLEGYIICTVQISKFSIVDCGTNCYKYFKPQYFLDHIFFQKVLTEAVDLRDWETLFLMGPPEEVHLSLYLTCRKGQIHPQKGCGVFIAWDDGECQTFVTRMFIYQCPNLVMLDSSVELTLKESLSALAAVFK
jgi:hypothetical protein